MKEVETTYVLEDLWFGKWHFVKEHEDKEYLKTHAEDVAKRLKETDMFLEYKYRIREKGIK